MNDSSRVTGGGESGSCTQNRLVKISETLQTERRRIEARGWAGGLTLDEILDTQEAAR